jgi:hypothetical protein
MENTSGFPNELEQDLKFLDRTWKTIEQGLSKLELDDEDKEILRRTGEKMADRYQNVFFYDALNRSIRIEHSKLKKENQEAIECLKEHLGDEEAGVEDNLMSLLNKALFKPGELGALRAKERFDIASSAQ